MTAVLVATTTNTSSSIHHHHQSTGGASSKTPRSGLQLVGGCGNTASGREGIYNQKELVWGTKSNAARAGEMSQARDARTRSSKLVGGRDGVNGWSEGGGANGGKRKAGRLDFLVFDVVVC